MYVSLFAAHSATEWFEHPVVRMPPKTRRQRKESFWDVKEVDRYSGWVTFKKFNQRGRLIYRKELYDPEYEHWPMKIIDKNTGMVIWKRFDKHGKLEVKEFYDPQYERWPIKVVDKHTGIVTWKRFDEAFNLEVEEFYVPELHDPEAQPRLGWAFCYLPQPTAATLCSVHSRRLASSRDSAA